MLEFTRDLDPGIENAPVLTAPKHSSKFMSHHRARNWWKKVEKLAGLILEKGR